MESNIGSELIVTLAWRSAEVAALGAATLLFIALIVRRYLEWEARTHARVIAAWRPLLTRIAIEGDEAPALPPLPTGTCRTSWRNGTRCMTRCAVNLPRA